MHVLEMNMVSDGVRFFMREDVKIAPDICNENGSCRDEVPVYLIIFHSTMRKGDWEGLVPSRCLLDDGRNILERAEVAEQR